MPSAALVTLREISPVARFCCSTDAGDSRRVAVDLLHACGDLADGIHRARGRVLHRRNMIGDVLGRLGGLYRERFHLGGDHGKPFACLASTGGLDGGVKREQIRLPGNVADQLDHITDLLRAIGEPGNFAVGIPLLFGSEPDDTAGLC